MKTGIPFMLHDNTGSLLGSDFVDLYDRMNLRVSCRRRDPDGAALYEVYNMLSRLHGIPVAVFEFGGAGALGNIELIGPGGPVRTQTMATFLVEVGGYANAISPFPPSPSAPFAYKHSRRISAKHRPRHRKFIASDGNEYSWSWRTSTHEDLEWTVSILRGTLRPQARVTEHLLDLQCVNTSGHTVAWYAVSSGRMFGVEEPYPHLVVGKTLPLLRYKTLKDRVN